MELEVKKIVESEIITYTRKVRRVSKTFKELRYFVKWVRYSEDENTWETPNGLENAREVVERFHIETRECWDRKMLSKLRKVFHKWPSKAL